MGTTEQRIHEMEASDGRLELKESYRDGDESPHLVSIRDYRTSTLDAVAGATKRDTHISLLFDYNAEQNRLIISRVFANSERGGHALDMRPSLISEFLSSQNYVVSDISQHATIIDPVIRDLVETQYGSDVYIDMRTVGDRLRWGLYNAARAAWNIIR